MFGYVQICSDMFKYLPICSDTFRYIQICSDMFRYVQICSDMFGYVRICSDMFRYVQIFSDLFRYVQVCSDMFCNLFMYYQKKPIETLPCPVIERKNVEKIAIIPSCIHSSRDRSYVRLPGHFRQ